nr:ABC transporter ATP-binding protein [Streptococcus dysgalactiae]
MLINGYSGCGKSSLALLLSGLKEAQEGRILLDGEIINSDKVGIVFQNPDLQFCMDTVGHELQFVLENREENPSTILSRIEQVLETVGLAKRQGEAIQTLSQGEKQRLSLACLLLKEPKLMILDEAFANLDEESALTLLNDVLRFQQEKQSTLIVIDHLVDYYAEKMDRYFWFDRGLHEVSFEKLKNYFPTLMVPETEPQFSSEVLRTSQFQVTVAKNKKISYPDLSLSRGERICLDGPSGVGKSSFFFGLLGLYRHKGTIKRPSSSLTDITFLFQNPMDQFIFETVYQEIYQTCLDEKRTKIVLEKLNLWHKRKASPFQLSQGQQRRLAVGIVLASEASLVLLDEPTYGQDAYHSQIIINLLLDYCQQKNAGLIFTTHDSTLKQVFATRYVEVCPRES